MLLHLLLLLAACLPPSFEKISTEGLATSYDLDEDQYRLERGTDIYDDQSQSCGCPANVTASGYHGDPLTCGVVTGTLLAYHCPCEVVTRFPSTCIRKIGEDKRAGDIKFSRTAQALARFAKENCPSHLSDRQAEGLGDMIADVASRFQTGEACREPQNCVAFQKGGACFLYASGVPPQSRGQGQQGPSGGPSTSSGGSSTSSGGSPGSSGESYGSPGGSPGSSSSGGSPGSSASGGSPGSSSSGGSPGKPGSQFYGMVKPFLDKLSLKFPGGKEAESVSVEKDSTSLKA